MKIIRCPYYSQIKDFDGKITQINCICPSVTEQLYAGLTPRCPFTTEYECDVPIHLRNVGRKK